MKKSKPIEFKCFVITLNSLKINQSIFEMRFGHFFLFPKMIFQKNLISFSSLFLLSLATQSLKIIFSFHPRQGSPHTGDWCIISPSVSSFVSLGATLPFISFCLPHWGLIQFEYCSSKWLGFPLQHGFLIIFVSSKSSHVITKKKEK